jgi:3-methyladenine DNA glycosylase Tag
MQAPTVRPPKEWSIGERPSSDDAYFENLSRIVFRAGLNWNVIEAKWNAIRQAYANFSVDTVAQFGDREVAQMLNNPDMIRHQGKIQATILNAHQFQTIRKQYGSFQNYLNRIDKTNNYAMVVKELTKQFRWLGPLSARLFLYSVGENVRYQP